MYASTNLVLISQDRAVTTSLAIADRFNKLHKDVLRTIKNLIGQISSDWHERNFAPMQNITETFNGGSRKDPAYEITRDGFALLAMGFTGKEALEFKIQYIDAFNAMEKKILERSNQFFKFELSKPGCEPNTLEAYIEECAIGRSYAYKYIETLKANPLMASGRLLPKIVNEIHKRPNATDGVMIAFLAKVEEYIANREKAVHEFENITVIL